MKNNLPEWKFPFSIFLKKVFSWRPESDSITMSAPTSSVFIPSKSLFPLFGSQ